MNNFCIGCTGVPIKTPTSRCVFSHENDPESAGESLELQLEGAPINWTGWAVVQLDPAHHGFTELSRSGWILDLMGSDGCPIFRC